MSQLRREVLSREELKKKERKCRAMAKKTMDVNLRTFYTNAAQGFAHRAARLIVLR